MSFSASPLSPLSPPAVALAGTTRWVWTEPKAERIVARDATVRLQGPDRALEAQLRASARLYGGLALAALENERPDCGRGIPQPGRAIREGARCGARWRQDRRLPTARARAMPSRVVASSASAARRRPGWWRSIGRARRPGEGRAADRDRGTAAHAGSLASTADRARHRKVGDDVQAGGNSDSRASRLEHRTSID